MPSYQTFLKLVQDHAVATDRVMAFIRERYQLDTDEGENTTHENGANNKERVVKALDRKKPFALSEDFTHKRPFGFMVNDFVVSDLKTWKQLYWRFFEYLHLQNFDGFAELPEIEKLHTRRGKPNFSINKEPLRDPMKVPGGLYVESNLSANGMVGQIRQLIAHFQLDEEQVRIYLREDRDAERLI